jgi:hypothetical protein
MSANITNVSMRKPKRMLHEVFEEEERNLTTSMCRPISPVAQICKNAGNSESNVEDYRSVIDLCTPPKFPKQEDLQNGWEIKEGEWEQFLEVENSTWTGFKQVNDFKADVIEAENNITEKFESNFREKERSMQLEFDAHLAAVRFEMEWSLAHDMEDARLSLKRKYSLP